MARLTSSARFSRDLWRCCIFILLFTCAYLFYMSLYTMLSNAQLQLNPTGYDDKINPATSKHNRHSITSAKHVTVIIISCGRWATLAVTIESFERYNTYPFINRRIVIDDCQDTTGLHKMNKTYHALYGYQFYSTSIPRSRKWPYIKTSYRAVASMYEALTRYTSNETEWVFVLEDDWMFYRKGFIEDSFLIIRDYNNSKRVNLAYQNISMLELRLAQLHRPFQDIRSFCGGPQFFRFRFSSTMTMHKNDRESLEYRISQHNDDCNKHYSNHPALRYKALLVENIKSCIENASKSMIHSFEYCVGCQYRNKQYSMAITTHNGYVGHTGTHVDVIHDNLKRKQNDETRYSFNTSFDLYISHLNKVIDLGGMWLLNQTNCQYFQRPRSKKTSA
eukprot:563787_1